MDAKLPPPRSSSPLASETGNGLDSSLPEGFFDAAMEHSYIPTAKDVDSGDSEGRLDSKQKRKRTSPKDQAILEAEYKQNPKPNKAARAEIVKKVDLNEKEVQIWFQNRRQINRRKSRPLLPHEIAAYGLGGMAALSSDPAPMFPFGSSQIAAELPSSSQPEPLSTQDLDDSSSCQDEIEILQPAQNVERPQSSQSERTNLAAAEVTAATLPPASKSQGPPSLFTADVVSSSVDETVIKSFSSTPGYLANRWNSINNSFTTPSSSQIPPSITPPIFTGSQPVSCPGRIDESVSTPTSSIRLSLSLEGKAELTTSSPSPPQKHTPRPDSCSMQFVPHKRMRTLERSQSAYTLSRPSMNQAHAPFPPRLPTGRSMDARTWELCCDSEPRDALTLQAENESHGSAIAAISLIRSTSSSSSALKPNSSKRNAPLLNKSEASKHGKRPKLGRAASSLARLQSPMKTSSKPSPDPYDHDGLMRSPSGDSDKENWIPREGGGNSRRRPLPSSRSSSQANSRAVLGDNHNVLSHAALGGNKNRKRKLAMDVPKVFEDTEEVPEEVEKFMRGEISPSKKGDLDCVQGLLSLSQGNWR